MIWSRETDGYRLSYSFLSGEQLQFRFNHGGNELSVRHNLQDRRDAALLLLGMGFAAALHLRRTPLLHAASVATGNGAIALVGESGAGKSTLAGALVQAGCPFVCDDLAALQLDTNGVCIWPGHPLLKIHGRAAVSLGISGELFQPVFHSFPAYEERWVDTGALPGGAAVSRLPLRCVYILSGRRSGLERPIITPLEPSRGCLELTRQLYGRDWLNISPKEAFEVSARIAGHLSFRRVLLPEGINSSAASAAGIMADAAALSR